MESAPINFCVQTCRRIMIATSFLEISAKAYRQNIRYIRKEIGPKPTISAVVKGNAYGHGIAQMVEIAEKAGIRHFSTFSSDEAWMVRQNSTKNSEIMILGMLYEEEMPQLIQAGISFAHEMARLKLPNQYSGE